MGKVIPLIDAWAKKVMIFEALLALDEFKEKGDRKVFENWRERWVKELDLIEKTEEKV